MADEQRQGSIFEEMMARRSRSDDLSARAIDRGVAVQSVESVAPVSDEVVSVELTPVFEADESETLAVSEVEIQEEAEPSPAVDEALAEVEPGELDEDEIVSAGVEEVDTPLEQEVSRNSEEVGWEPESLSESIEEEASSRFVEEEESVEEEIEEQPHYFSDMDSLEEVDEPVESEIEEPVAEVDEAEASAVSAEQLIVESEDLLGEAPEFDTEAEVTKVAEELVDRIGPIVDIQSLPKTQPSRVLSKTTKPKEVPPVDSEQAVEEAKAPVKGVDYSDTLEEATQVKKKKKKVSLLDSYFKGL